MQINVTYDNSLNSLSSVLVADFKEAVTSAVDYFDSLFKNDITLTIQFGWGEVNGTTIGSGSVGENISYYNNYTYTQIADAVKSVDTTSTIQVDAASLLGTDPSGGTGNYWISTALADTLGLAGSPGLAGYVGLNSSESYSWSQSSIASGTYDAVGVLEHEISEVLGRVSFGGKNEFSDGSDYTLLDNFDYTGTGSFGTATGRDWNADTNSAQGYFSYNGTTTTLAFDPKSQDQAGNDVADWSSSVGDDSFGYAFSGEKGVISQTDLQVMNVLGYQVANTVSQSAPTSLTATENASAGLSGLSISTSSQIGDAANTVLTLTLSASHGVFTASTATGLTIGGAGTAALTLTGTQSIINAALAAASYHPNANYVGSDTISATTVDQIGDTSGAKSIAVTVQSSSPCYARGSRILTPSGEVEIERLTIGGLVTTAFGEARPIRWIGHRWVDCANHPDPFSVWPVRIAAGAIADQRPTRDLVVSPDHSLYIDGALTRAAKLLNGTTIRRERPASVEYWHVELETHDILVAEALPAESYLDCGNRAAFAENDGPVDLHPRFAPSAEAEASWRARSCAPRADEGETIVAMRERVARRALALGARTTGDPGLQLIADGETLTPIAVEARRFRFEIPEGATELRLVSRAAIPADMAALENCDSRRLGVRVSDVFIDGSSVEANHPAFQRGWHEIEVEGGRESRWTVGDAALPLGRQIEFQIDTLPQYPLASRSDEPARAFRRAVSSF